MNLVNFISRENRFEIQLQLALKVTVFVSFAPLFQIVFTTCDSRSAIKNGREVRGHFSDLHTQKRSSVLMDLSLSLSLEIVLSSPAYWSRLF